MKLIHFPIDHWSCLFSNLTLWVGDQDNAEGEDEDAEGDLDDGPDVAGDFSFVLGHSEHLEPDVRSQGQNCQSSDQSDVLFPNLKKNW